MATASTKRGRKRKAQGNWGAVSSSSSKGQAQGAGRGNVERDEPAAVPDLPERVWRAASAAILFAAAVLRFVAPGIKPFHHDEGVNGFFLTNLMRHGRYVYDPANYHGPTLYYLTLPLAALAEALSFLDSWVLRAVPALFGVATVWLVLSLRRRIGAVAALAAAALVAVSPACVFYSRYFIHEMPFVFFTLALVVAALRLEETGSGKYLLLASASAALMFATKETAFISVGTLGLAWLVAHLWVRLTRGRGAARHGGEGGLLAGFRARPGALLYAVEAAALFAAIWVAFYSSFFTNWKGVFWDSFRAFDIWKDTGMSEFHSKPFHTYVKWLLQEDASVLVLAAAGSAVALFRRGKNRFAIFVGAWGFGLMAAYSLISYKTPWLVLNFVVPMALAAGYAVQAAGGFAASRAGRVAAAWRGKAALTAALVAICISLYQTVIINFAEYDNDQYPYVYSQTRRELLDLVREVERLGERAGTKEPGVGMASPEYWPLPWYFRDNPRAGFEGSISSRYDPKSTLVVIGRETQLPQLQRLLAEEYVRVGGLYPLRPGVNLVLFGRRDLAGR